MDRKAVVLLTMMAAMAVQAAAANETGLPGVSTGEKGFTAPGVVMNDEGVAAPQKRMEADTTAIPGRRVETGEAVRQQRARIQENRKPGAL